VVISRRPRVFLALGFLATIVGMIGAGHVRLNADFKESFNAVYLSGWEGFSAAEVARMDQQFAAFILIAIVGFCLAAVATFVLFRQSRSRDVSRTEHKA